MNRRALLKAGVLSAAAFLLAGHTPYGQWVIYRKRHLLILTSKTDPPSYALGKRVAAILARRLPSSLARVTRAPYTRRVASLLSSKQLDVAILSQANAERLMHGRPPFAAYGPLALRTLVSLGDYLLVCRADFPPRHAYLVTATLAENADGLPLAAAAPGDSVPPHPGAQAYFEGGAMPEKAAAAK